jgi:hypothetical protein
MFRSPALTAVLDLSAIFAATPAEDIACAGCLQLIDQQPPLAAAASRRPTPDEAALRPLPRRDALGDAAKLAAPVADRRQPGERRPRRRRV